MKELHKQIKKLSKSIEGYYNKVRDISYEAKDWQKDQGKINTDINSFEKVCQDLTEELEKANENSIDPGVVKKIQSDFDNCKNKIKPCIYSIKEKVMTFSPLDMNQPEESNKESEHQIMAQDLLNNQEVLQQRRKELEEIHKTAAVLKDTTDQMVLDVNNQGAQLDEIEANVITSKENAEKAKDEIIKADNISKGNRKKMCCLIAIIFVAIGAITAILLSIILNK